MKQIVLFIVVLFVVSMNTMAQNRSINFEQVKEWKKIIKKAKKEKKLIFLDCYTSWCGPCKLLARDVFTKDEVADFFNARFVNVKFDMEKDADGVMLKKQFEVKFFPTLIFVDPVSGEVLHRLVGAGTPEWLIAGGKLALDPDNNLRSLMKRYGNGEREPGLIRDYAGALFSAYSRDEAVRVACEYLNPLPLDSLMTPENWALIKRVVTDPLCPVLKRIMAEREKCYSSIGQKEVDSKLEKAINTAVKELTKWNPDLRGVKPFNEEGNRALIDYLKSIDFYAAPGGLACLYTAAYVREKDFRGMLDKMDEVFSYNLFRNGTELPYFMENMRFLMVSKDDQLIKEGILRISEVIDQYPEIIDKINLTTTKSLLQKSVGDTVGAEISKKEIEKYKVMRREDCNKKVLRK